MTDYYTGIGDCGTTNTMSKSGVDKSDSIVCAIGDVDELNSTIGVALSQAKEPIVKEYLGKIQNNLFKVGAMLASAQMDQPSKYMIAKADTEDLERAIKEMSAALPELKEFVLPGGTDSSASLHVCRSVARRAERGIVASSRGYKIEPEVLAYVNRISSFMFVAALYTNVKASVTEKHPVY